MCENAPVVPQGMRRTGKGQDGGLCATLHHRIAKELKHATVLPPSWIVTQIWMDADGTQPGTSIHQNHRSLQQSRLKADFRLNLRGKEVSKSQSQIMLQPRAKSMSSTLSRQSTRTTRAGLSVPRETHPVSVSGRPMTLRQSSAPSGRSTRTTRAGLSVPRETHPVSVRGCPMTLRQSVDRHIIK